MKFKKKKISNETLYNYIDNLCKAVILKKVYRYDIASKREFVTYKLIEDNYPKYVISFDKVDLSRDGLFI